MNEPRRSRSRGIAARLTAGAGALVLGLTFVVAGGFGSADASMASFDGTVSLTTDAGASALFEADDLAPGDAVTSCLVVTYEGEPDPVDLRLQAATDGDLDEHLDLVIETGEGGSHQDCAGFAGVTQYEGTLAAFVATYGDHADGLAVTGPAAAGDAVSFRFTLSLGDDPSAQGLSSTAVYTWTAALAEPRATEPPATDLPEPPATQPPEATAPPSQAIDDLTPDDQAPPPTEPPSTEAPPAPPGAAATPPPLALPGRPDAEPTAPDGSATHEDEPAEPRIGRRGAPEDASAGDQDPGGGTGSLGSGFDVSRVLPSAWDEFVRITMFVAERSSYLLLLVGVVLLFLAIQNRIDRKDPKLALAPRDSDLDLTFEPPPGGERDR